MAMGPIAVFSGACPTCKAERRFIEVRVEACLQPDQGPVKAWRGFRCMGCSKKVRTVTSPDGVHRYDGDRHVVDAANGPEPEG